MGKPSSDSGAIRQVIRALVAAGYKLGSVDDGDDFLVSVKNETEAVEAITAVDEATLAVYRDVEGGRSHAWVLFVMGNEPFEVVCDHTMDLSPVLDPLFDRWEA